MKLLTFYLKLAHGKVVTLDDNLAWIVWCHHYAKQKTGSPNIPETKNRLVENPWEQQQHTQFLAQLASSYLKRPHGLLP